MITTDLVAGLAPIGLDELVERASLLTRIDRKYLLPASSLPVILGGLPRDASVLEIGGSRHFAYRSEYFDTPGLDSYLTTAQRRRRRFKLRIRSYLDSDLHLLEIKTRGARGATVKHRFPYAGDGVTLSTEMLDHAVRSLKASRVTLRDPRFEAVITTRFERITLLLPSTGSRATIDRDLTWTLPDGSSLHLPDRVIVETKSPRGASPLDRLLWSLSHRPCPISKYATGMAALRPELPDNRWHRILRQHFALSEAS
ncbi:polyphosphate polymerase domain-containing protein [Paractinoplanes durhamensis]|uniref:VTC domain-containing protein n=1 Tax=Paractinoplanes durhamensis TaxID=113563 RepID=A0ABQ3YZI5_9ACTN|nr:polyphosphate polymerase domain-containing protein [Actinoplanes durhamensis]GIE03007.1 VTC domain-containing protein [Actinoplanes durhamensis]